MQSGFLLSSKSECLDAESSIYMEIVVEMLMLGVAEAKIDTEESDVDTSDGVVDPRFFVTFWVESFPLNILF